MDIKWKDTIKVIAAQHNQKLSDEQVENMTWEQKARGYVLILSQLLDISIIAFYVNTSSLKVKTHWRNTRF